MAGDDNTVIPSKGLDRPRRWDVSYAEELEGSRMNRQMASELLDGALSSLKQDVDRFPANLSILDILANDCRVRKFVPDEIVVRKGDYGNSAFFILSGRLNVVSSNLPQEALGRGRSVKAGRVLARIANVLLGRRPYPEIRDLGRKGARAMHQSTQLNLQDFPEALTSVFALPQPDSMENPLGGELFGEIAAMGRTPRTATVLAGEAGAELLEIRWQGLRDIRKYSPGWREMIDERYRKYSLQSHLGESRYTRNLSREKTMPNPRDPENEDLISQMDYLADRTEFRSFGDFEWYGSYREIAKVESQERLALEPLIVEQDSQVNGLTLIRSGFVRVRRRYNHGEKTISYLGKGKSYGLVEIYYNWKKRTLGGEGRKEVLGFQHTLSAVSYVDALFIPLPVVEEIILPNLTKSEIAELEKAVVEIDREYENPQLNGNLLEFLVEERAMNGSAAMLIDLDRCTRCDDCVRACAATHDNNPRFVRAGPELNGIQLTHACMHCEDPICMIGCPTGAIHRSEVGQQVLINDFTCIGCATCAENCPYNNIQMVEIRDASGDLVPGTQVNAETQSRIRVDPVESSIRKATKCDLCQSVPTGPACQYACPHNALVRIDLRNSEPLEKWLSR